MIATEPVFLHSSFRTSSTWLWSKFRASSTNLAYYEVFNDGLASLRAEDVPNIHGGTWLSRHPPEAPYFLEFVPLIRPQGGVAGYLPEMASERFIPPDGLRGALTANEASYVASLIAHARSLGRRPVISATRSLGRIAAIRQAFPGLHVVICRNLFRQWCSYAEQYHRGNPYFILSIDRVIAASRHDPFLDLIAYDLGPDGKAAPGWRLFQAFTLMHLYLYAHAASVADLWIDADHLAADAAYRGEVEVAAADRLGQRLDFGDAQASIGFMLETLPDPPLIAARLNDGIASIRRAIPNLPPESEVLLQNMANGLITEYELWCFYSGRLREHFLQTAS